MSFKKVWRMMQHPVSVKKGSKRECKAKIKLMITQMHHLKQSVKWNNSGQILKDEKQTFKILLKLLKRISEAAVIGFLGLHHIRKSIRLQQQANQQLPNLANREDAFELPLEYQRSCVNGQFLIFDSGPGDADRILIFGKKS